MARLIQDVKKTLKKEFTGLVNSLEQDQDVIEAMPLEDVERELQKMGLDSDKFYAGIRKKTHKHRLKE